MARRIDQRRRTRGNPSTPPRAPPVASLAAPTAVSAILPPPISPTPASSPTPNVHDARLERLLDGVSDARLASALGPRLDLLFAERLTFLDKGLADLTAQNADHLAAHDRLATRLDTMAADLSKLQSDCVRHGHFDAETKLLQGQILEISLRLTRTFDDTDSDGPPHRSGRTPTRGRSDRDQDHDRKKFRDHPGLQLSALTPASVRTFYNLLCHICHSCNLPLLQLDSIVEDTVDLCPPNVPGPERKQHSKDLYFKLASHGVLPQNKHTYAWIKIFLISADGYGLLYQLSHHAIPALTMSVPNLPTWHEFPDVYRLAAAFMDYFQVDTDQRRKAPRSQSSLYLSAIKDDSLAESIGIMKDRLHRCAHDHTIPSDLRLASLPTALRPLSPDEPPADPESISILADRIRFSVDL
jgi:hypothetical protein